MKARIKNRKINEDGLVIQNPESLFESLFLNPKLIDTSNSEDTQEIQEYNKWAKIYDYPEIKTNITNIDHKVRQDTWFMPDEYKNLDIEKYVLKLCSTEEEIERVNIELCSYKERNLYNLLRYMVYLGNIIKENDIIIGVGRGSSVSSYILYLLGIHRINSLKYDLDIKEFLK